MQHLLYRISGVIRTLYNTDFSPEVSTAPKPELGEYCINVFPLAKTTGKAPNIISAEVAAELAKQADVFVSTSATGGYVNFFLADKIWIDIFGSTKNQKPKDRNETILVDYIGANVGKPLHIGHICTPSIGQVICNIYNHLGYKVIGDSHFGDWGGIFGKLIYQWKKTSFVKEIGYLDNKERKETDVMNRDKLESPHLWGLNISYLVQLYQDFHINTTEPDEIGARTEFQYLSGVGIDLSNPEELKHHEENVELWKKFTAISLSETEKKLKLLNVETTYNIGESFYEGIGLPRPNHEDYPELEFTMKDIVRELVALGVATKNEDNSVGVVFPEETKMPSCILQKKDGTGLYLTSDLAAIKYRLTNGWNPRKLIYSVDARQQLHLKQAFWIAKQAWPELAKDVEFFHASNGFIKLKEGAMSTRHGTVIFLESLIDEGNERTSKILQDKGRVGDKALDKEDIQAITIGAIKYSYLSQDREKDVVFDWDKALSFEGNSGPYIQYAYVRASKIISSTTANLDAQFPNELPLSSYDKLLIGKLANFDAIINTTATTYKPHHLALYAYDLAVGFNSFYVHTPKILEEPNEDLRNIRLSLVSRVANTLEKAFELLAIKMPSEM